jgi:hypothetical protein
MVSKIKGEGASIGDERDADAINSTASLDHIAIGTILTKAESNSHFDRIACDKAVAELRRVIPISNTNDDLFEEYRSDLERLCS